MWDVNVPGKVKEEGEEKGGQGVKSKSRAHASPASRQVVLYRLVFMFRYLVSIFSIDI